MGVRDVGVRSGQECQGGRVWSGVKVESEYTCLSESLRIELVSENLCVAFGRSPAPRVKADRLI